jgi:hypothetical protein
MTENMLLSDSRDKEPIRPFDRDHPDHPDDTGNNAGSVAKANRVILPPSAPTTIPITKKGQKYVAPTGRHSQQTHRRAEERAAAQGHTSEKEQHAYDRSVVKTELNRRAAQSAKNQQPGKTSQKTLPEVNSTEANNAEVKENRGQA